MTYTVLMCVVPYNELFLISKVVSMMQHVKELIVDILKTIK